MPKNRSKEKIVAPEYFFSRELAGEEPPSWAAMKRLYQRSGDLFGLKPWELVSETELIATVDSETGETWFSSIMGSMGEVFMLQAFRGSQGLELFKRISSNNSLDPVDVLPFMHTVSVEYGPRSLLQRQDRELLAAFGHPTGKRTASPIFRAIRPGFHPWFVNADEARTLAECIRSVVVVCATLADQDDLDFWETPGSYPQVTRKDGDMPTYDISAITPKKESRQPNAAVVLPDKFISPIRGKDFRQGGKMELEYRFSGASIGKPHERPACAAFALAVDAETGLVYAPEATTANVPPPEVLARVFVNAVKTIRMLPAVVYLKSPEYAASLRPLMESFGIQVKVSKHLPAAEDAFSNLSKFMGELN